MPENDAVDKITVTIDVELEDLIPEFLKNRAADIETVREYLDVNNFDAIRLLGHSLKGNGAGYGFDDLSVVGRDLEQAAEEESVEGISKAMADMASYLEKVDVVFE